MPVLSIFVSAIKEIYARHTALITVIYFPSPELALREPNGLLALGGI